MECSVQLLIKCSVMGGVYVPQIGDKNNLQRLVFATSSHLLPKDVKGSSRASIYVARGGCYMWLSTLEILGALMPGSQKWLPLRKWVGDREGRRVHALDGFRDRHRDSPSSDARDSRGWGQAEAGSLALSRHLPAGWQGPSSSSHCLYLPEFLSAGSWDWEWGQDWNPGTLTEQLCHAPVPRRFYF